MKAILISIRPEWVAKILNGKKTIEIRKTAPKLTDPIDVYIYCTKTIKPVTKYNWGNFTFDDLPKLGKVVAKFRLERVHNFFQMPPDKEWVLKASCLSEERLLKYIGNLPWYGWEIKDLIIFDKPKELSEFKEDFQSWVYDRKPRPPFSWQYVEVVA